jgi:hypothetical protein
MIVNKRIIQTLLLIGLFGAGGCDPGMIIRQAAAVAPGSGTNGKGVAIQVRTGHPLIYSTWYTPYIKITNNLESPISITRVELITAGPTYQPKSLRDIYPLLVMVGETTSLEPGFDLTSSVYKTFAKRAELRVYYRIGDKELFAHAWLEGAPLSSE